MNNILKSYFNFSKKETIASIVLLITIVAVIILPYFIKNKQEQQKIDISFAEKVNAVLTDENPNGISDSINSSYKQDYTTTNKTSVIHPFSFDPNSISENDLLRLGLSPKLAKTICNYRNKGGHFYKPDDFRKIWGLKKEDADILIPFINIANTNDKKYVNTFNSKITPKSIASIDVNTATVNEFRQLPAVGNLAYKIVKYRDKLGGFLNINQIKETYDLTDSIFNAMQPYLTLQTQTINKLNINTASDFELAGHPYISKEIAKAIVIYRNQHGNYHSVQDLKKIIFIKKDLIDKIAPYLTVE